MPTVSTEVFHQVSSPTVDREYCSVVIPTPSPGPSVIYVQAPSDSWALGLTTALSVVAILVSLLAIGWNIWAFLLAGPRIRVQMWLKVSYDDGAWGRIPAGAWPEKLSDIDARPGYEIEIEAISVGRAAVTVGGIGVDFGGGWASHSSRQSAELPHTIPAGGPSVSWTVADHEIADWIQDDPRFTMMPSRIRGLVKVPGRKRAIASQEDSLPVD